MPKDYKTFSIVLDEETVSKLDKIAEVKGVARNKILVALVTNYVSENWEQTQKAMEAMEAARKARDLIG